MKRLKIAILTVCSLLVLSSIFAQNYNRPNPEGTYPYEFVQLAPVPDGYFLTTATKIFIAPTDPDFVSPYPAIFDKDGYLIWYAKPQAGSLLDFKFFPEIDRYTYTITTQGNVSSHVLDLNFSVVDTLITSSSQDVHDLQLAANGNWLIMTFYLDTMDLSAFTFNGVQGAPNTIVKGIGYQEIDPSGTFVNEWNSNDFLSPTETLDFW